MAEPRTNIHYAAFTFSDGFHGDGGEPFAVVAIDLESRPASGGKSVDIMSFHWSLDDAERAANEFNAAHKAGVQ